MVVMGYIVQKEWDVQYARSRMVVYTKEWDVECTEGVGCAACQEQGWFQQDVVSKEWDAVHCHVQDAAKSISTQGRM